MIQISRLLIAFSLVVVLFSSSTLLTSAASIDPSVMFSVRDNGEINPTNLSTPIVCGDCNRRGVPFKDEGFVEFEIDGIGTDQVVFEFWLRDLVKGSTEPHQHISLDVYAGDGVASIDDYGQGDLFAPQIVYDLPISAPGLGSFISLDVSDKVSDLASQNISHIGFRFYDSRHVSPPPPPNENFVSQLQIYYPALRVVPEPGSLGLLVVGIVLMGLGRGRKRGI